MSLTNQGDPPVGGYLKGQSPSWASIQAGLAIFALFVIARYCVQRVCSWLRPLELEKAHPSSPSSYYYHQRRATNDPFLPRYQPRAWSTDEKPSSRHWATTLGGMANQGELHHDGLARAMPMEGSPRPASTSSSMTPLATRQFISRPPPAPPLTPPELSGAVFALEERRQADHESLIHQPNPDYISSTSSSAFEVDQSDTFIPRRRSYTRSLSMGGHLLRQGQQQHGQQGQQQQQQSIDARGGEQTLFSPVSFAGSDDLGSPAHVMTSGDGPSDPHSDIDHGKDDKNDSDNRSQRNVDVQGEIISVLDREGAGWTRHTRVYGGGACLACAAAGGGGFYGATVRPEEMR